MANSSRGGGSEGDVGKALLFMKGDADILSAGVGLAPGWSLE